MNKNLRGAVMFGQSGGPTSVINASAAGVLIEALNSEVVTDVYALEHGIRGILDERFFDISKEDMNELLLLKNTPAAAFGSVRYKLKDESVDEADYIRILEIFKKYNVRYFFYNGGNDSMDTCNKISKYLQKSGYECNIIGVPKTIDNDLDGTDHCPGFPSAAKYVATTFAEVYQDANVYDKGLVTIVEVMGRNAGWLTAASTLASLIGSGPDLVYLPENTFDVEQFLEEVKAVAARQKNSVLVAVSEGVKDKDGKYISEYAATSTKKDSFGHAQLGGVASVLAGIVQDALNVKVRPIELSLLQRCAAHLASAVDIEEAYMCGAMAVRFAIAGETDKMVVINRVLDGGIYRAEFGLLDVHHVANAEKKIPQEWINEDHSGLSKEFVDYALPLIQGEVKLPLENGLPRFARLKKVLATK